MRVADMKASHFRQIDPFWVASGKAPIAVGAPHHGTRPNVDADQGTGPVARALAAALDASAVVVSDLRRVADVNKNPLRLRPDVRHYARRYQDELFAAAPCLVVEVHGHTSGRYEVEVSSGFDLDPQIPGDASFLEKLRALKGALPEALAARTGRYPTLGVYPLDRDVRQTATDTFTFQKVRRARNLAGLEWYGLHIELSRELRTGPQAESTASAEALGLALAAAIRSVFEPLLAADTGLAAGVAEPCGATVLLAPRALRIAAVPARYAGEHAVVVNPADLESLEALDGDVVVVRHGLEELRTTLSVSRLVTPGRAGLPARLRRQISLGERGRITLGRPAPSGTGSVATTGQGVCVLRAVRDGHGRELWLAPGDIARCKLRLGDCVHVDGMPGAPSASDVVLHADPSLSSRGAAASRAVRERMSLTLGEVLVLNGSLP